MTMQELSLVEKQITHRLCKVTIFQRRSRCAIVLNKTMQSHRAPQISQLRELDVELILYRSRIIIRTPFR